MRPGSDMSRQNDLVIVAQLPQRPPLLVVQARQADHCRIVWKTARMHAERDHPLHFGKRQVDVPKRQKRERNHAAGIRSEEHTSELQSLMRISYAVFCLKKKQKEQKN